MSTSLYRAAAIAHQQETRLGQAFRTHTSMSLWLTSTLVIMALLIAAFLYCGQYTRKARVAGFLAPSQGLIKVYTPQSGTVTERKVEEGQRVQQGDVLFVLSTEQSSLENADAQAAAIATIQERQNSLLDELEQQDDLNRIQWQDLHTRQANLRTELTQLDYEITLQHKRSLLANQTRDKYQQLYKRGFVPEVQWQEKQEYALAQEASLHNLKRDQTGVQRQLDSLQSTIASSRPEFARQRAELDRQISSAEQQLTEYQARRSVVIRAPAAGTVSTVMLYQGQVANQHSPLLTILPRDSQLQVNLLVPSRAIGFIAPGQTVALRYQAFPYQRFGMQSGQVSQVTRTLIKPGEADFPIQLDEPAYRVIVELSRQSLRAWHQNMQQNISLQSGMLLDADIELDRYSLLQWIFDPLLSLAGRL